MAKRNVQSATVSRFVRSVHLELDHTKSDALSDYLLTAGSRRVLGRLIPALTDPAAARAWTLTGPYGTGKSAFTVFAAQLFAPKNFAGQGKARDILKTCDEDLFDLLPARSKQFRGLYPIAVTGSREPIPVALLRGLQAALLHSDSRAKPLIKQIAKLREATMGGENIGDRELIDLVTETGKVLAEGNDGPSGLFLILDEFGKLLEYSASHPERSDVYVLQHLQELAVRSDFPILILTVLHKDFIGYAERLSSRERAEWDKVHGRFEDIVFEESSDEVLRLIAMARKHAAIKTKATPSPLDRKKFEQLVGLAWKLNLAPAGMNKHDFGDQVSLCWPLHPLVSVLAGPIFRRLAQNERSVFSFLSSQEPHGLLDFIDEEKRPSLYVIDRFYDYLSTSLGEALYSHRNGKKWAEIEAALERLPEASAAERAVLKTIGLLNVVGSTRNVKASSEMIKFALAGFIEGESIDKAVNVLEENSVIVARGYSGSFALWEGSDVDIDERVKIARDRLDQSEPLAQVASRYIAIRPVVARKHAFKTGTLRYFSVHFVDAGVLATEIIRPSEADGRILVVLPRNPEEQAIVRRVVKTDGGKSTRVIIAVPSEIRSLDMCIRELAGLEWIRENTPELAGDQTARRELRARLSELRRQLDVLTEDMLGSTSERASTSEWFHNGKSAPVTTKRSLNDFISESCRIIFSKSPRILNELVNRRELSTAAAAARRNLIELMITKSDVPQLGLEGFPPEKSIYLSVLADPGIHVETENGWVLGAPRETADSGLRAVWNEIQTFFDSTEMTPRKVSELFEKLRAEPFGLRDGPIPLLFCASLIASDSDVALYENGSFVPQLGVPVFERLMKLPEAYAVRRWRISGVRTQVFRQLAEMLGKNWGMLKVTKKNVLDVVRPLLKFVAQLPEHTQRTDLLSDQTIRVRAALTQSREADQLLFSDLPKACGFDPFDADARLDNKKLDGFLAELKSSLGEMQRHFEILIADLGRAIGAAFDLDGTTSSVREKLIERADALRAWVADPALKNFVVRTLEEGDDRTWTESIAALLSERPPAMWRDADRSKFDVGIVRISRMFKNLEVLAFSDKKSTSKSSEGIRIGITSRDSGDLERVVHVDDKDRNRVDEIEVRLQKAIGANDVNGHRDIALAAIGRLVKALLSQKV